MLCVTTASSRYLLLFDFSRKLKAFLCGNNGDDFVNHGCCGYRTLHDLRKLRRRRRKNPAYDSRENERNAGMGQQRQTEILFYGIRHFRSFRTQPCPEIFTERSGGNVEESIHSRAENQVIIERRAQIHNGGEQGRCRRTQRPDKVVCRQRRKRHRKQG